ncbi:nucleotide-binding protein [Candidatus Woesearchaeota archaeon]|nr:nucleotide-binding protein [Candidatus Woesearchaeota archaeon]|tara:strand:+ start:4374 stop:4772 length:399 start_codon:yes stop_codon:yes gene_type:complete
MKTKIILDTNFLLIPVQFNVDIFSEIDRICNFNYQLVVVPETISELKKIINSRRRSGKEKKAAKMAIQFIKKFKVRITGNYGKVFKRADEAIMDIADNKSFVATQDKALRKMLKGRCGLIILRQKQYLHICE